MSPPTNDARTGEIDLHRTIGSSRRIFHGWLIVATAFIALAVNVGLLFYSWGVFLSPLAEAFGGRGGVSVAYSSMQVAAALYGLWVGRLVDRHGARPVQIVGAVAFALGYALVARAT